jgi:hypothetical protein
MVTGVKSLSQVAKNGGMGLGITDICVAAVPGTLLRLSRKLSFLYKMYVGPKTLIGQNMLDIDKSCNEMKHFIFN